MPLRFLGIGAGNRAAANRRRLLATTAHTRAEAESEEDMRQRHAEELRGAGYDEAPDPDAPPSDPPPPKPGKPAKGEPKGDDDMDEDASMRTGDEMPADDDPDPDAPPAEQDPEGDDSGEPDEETEAEEDEAIDREPDEQMRGARRAKLRRKRRAAARAAERGRCARIFQDPAAARNTPLAAQLAFNTSLSAKRVVAILRTGGGGGALGARMAGYGAPAIAIGSGAGAPAGAAPKAIATSWDAAMSKARNW
jgi:hypothetical protein